VGDNTIKLRAYTNPKEAEQRRRSLPIPVKVLNLMAMRGDPFTLNNESILLPIRV
jgi:hypothetical protein